MALFKSSPLTLPTSERLLPAGVPIIGWHNLVTNTNVVASSSNTSYPVSNLGNPSTVLEWRATGAGAQTLTTTFSSQTVDYVAIARHNFGTQDISVTLKRSGGSTIMGPVSPTTDEPIILWFSAETGTQVQVALGASTADPARAAVLYVGKLLVCERGVDVGSEFLIPRFARKTEMIAGRSARGDYLGSVVLSRFRAGMQIDFRHFTPDWYRSNFDPFLDEAQAHHPFFWHWHPSTYPDETAFVWLTEDPAPQTSPITGRVGVQLKVDGIRE